MSIIGGLCPSPPISPPFLSTPRLSVITSSLQNSRYIYHRTFPRRCPPRRGFSLLPHPRAAFLPRLISLTLLASASCLHAPPQNARLTPLLRIVEYSKNMSRTLTWCVCLIRIYEYSKIRRKLVITNYIVMCEYSNIRTIWFSLLCSVYCSAHM